MKNKVIEDSESIDNKNNAINFIKKSFDILICSIYPSITNLRIHFILKLLIEYFNSNIFNNYKIEYEKSITTQTINTLFYLMYEGWDDVREMVVNVLDLFPISVYDKINLNEQLIIILNKTKSDKPKDIDGSGRLLYFIYKKYILDNNKEIHLLNCEKIEKEQKEFEDYKPNDNKLKFIHNIFQIIYSRIPSWVIEKRSSEINTYPKIQVYNLYI